ncbi:NIL domain-containing protein [Rivularia sp. UHCC 0363]|uniref:NIL domain-containing protein n=1 Tax=Rivularia sp. UHCC 0363 TaxID=3110244 RepID=UPI002B1F2212|nr:NIL domain-containing protein [Rivularia sp. UHCC 0363]MEA5597158.1 NIL domain-containing protein [Rivularia sp. UHCC 0363]
MSSNNTLTQKQIRVRIPKDYHDQPVISHLVSDYHLEINIRSAILGGNAIGDGWFVLDLQGTDQHIKLAINYLHNLALEVWDNHQSYTW